MKFYKTTYTNPAADVGRTACATWSSTLREASVDRKRLQALGMHDISTQDVDFPTAKHRVMAHLNMWEVVV